MTDEQFEKFLQYPLFKLWELPNEKAQSILKVRLRQSLERLEQGESVELLPGLKVNGQWVFHKVMEMINEP